MQTADQAVLQNALRLGEVTTLMLFLPIPSLRFYVRPFSILMKTLIRLTLIEDVLGVFVDGSVEDTEECQ